MREVSGGGIRVDARLTRPGVFEYLLPDGNIRREYRPPEEVHRKDSMASADCLPVGDDHPEELLELETEHEYRLGLTGEGTRKDSEGWLVNSIVVRDPALIEKMKRGKVFVSCGYDCDLEEKSGTTPQGERYDAIQRNIVYNHVAIVDVPRAGARARVRMDAAFMQTETKETDMPNLAKKLAKALADTAAANARADAAEARADAKKKKDELVIEEESDEEEADEDKMDEDDEEGDKEIPAFIKKKMKKDGADFVDAPSFERMRARADGLEAENKTLRTENKRLKKGGPRLDSADIQKRVKERVALEKVAGPILRQDSEDDEDALDITAMSDREVKVAVIKTVDKKDCADVKRFSDDYVNARFDSVVERVDESDDEDLDTEDYDFERQDAADADDEAKAARKMRERSANRWRADAADNDRDANEED